MSGKASRRKGHAYELEIVNMLKDMGYTAVSSRSESKNMDDKGVDIITNFPLHIQAKAWKAAPSYHAVLKGMPTDKFRAIFHKRPNKGTVVVMEMKDFFDLIAET